MQFGIIGKTLTHSFSAYIHPKLYDCKYEKCELDETEIQLFFEKKDFKGINVTIPYKQTVIPYLDVLDKTALSIGAVNTIVNKNGILYGYNTDFLGLKELISKNNVDIKNKNVIILGSGGTSLTARAVCESLGAKRITRFSRVLRDDCETYDNIENYYNDTDVIINTTPCGMYPNIYESAIELDGFKSLTAVFDVVYNPIRTKLICDAKKRGITAEGGTCMLVFQALFAGRLFSGLDLQKSKGNEIFDELIRTKENVVLIGMPSSGKTTIGKEIDVRLNRTFIDSDEEILKQVGLSSKEIIEKYGEKEFRKIESNIIFELSKMQGAVIATGGGVVLEEKNIDLLKENGKIIFLDRNLENLFADSSRPLSSTREKLKEVYDFRLPIYKNSTDITIDNNGEINKTVTEIIKAMKI